MKLPPRKRFLRMLGWMFVISAWMLIVATWYLRFSGFRRD
jgi:high-affinity Fe2+/Pb2+ permease